MEIDALIQHTQTHTTYTQLRFEYYSLLLRLQIAMDCFISSLSFYISNVMLLIQFSKAQIKSAICSDNQVWAKKKRRRRTISYTVVMLSYLYFVCRMQIWNKYKVNVFPLPSLTHSFALPLFLSHTCSTIVGSFTFRPLSLLLSPRYAVLLSHYFHSV